MLNELNTNPKFVSAWCTVGLNDGEQWVDKIYKLLSRHELNDESDEVKKMLKQADVVKAIVREFLIEKRILDESGHLIAV